MRLILVCLSVIKKNHGSHFFCERCRSTLEGWLRGSRKCIPFAIRPIWRKPTTRTTILLDRHLRTRRNVQYPSIPSSIALVSHCEDLPIPSLPFWDAISNVDLSSGHDNDSNEADLNKFMIGDYMSSLIRDYHKDYKIKWRWNVLFVLSIIVEFHHYQLC